MNNESLTVFVESIANFFKTHTKAEVDIGAPFLIEDIHRHYQYFGQSQRLGIFLNAAPYGDLLIV